MSSALKTNKDLDIVRAEFRKAYNDWHCCKLSQKDARTLKVPLGTLCDVCENVIQTHMANIRRELRVKPE